MNTNSFLQILTIRLTLKCHFSNINNLESHGGLLQPTKKESPGPVISEVFQDGYVVSEADLKLVEDDNLYDEDQRDDNNIGVVKSAIDSSDEDKKAGLNQFNIFQNIAKNSARVHPEKIEVDGFVPSNLGVHNNEDSIVL